MSLPVWFLTSHSMYATRIHRGDPAGEDSEVGDLSLDGITHPDRHRRCRWLLRGQTRAAGQADTKGEKQDNPNRSPPSSVRPEFAACECHHHHPELHGAGGHQGEQRSIPSRRPKALELAQTCVCIYLDKKIKHRPSGLRFPGQPHRALPRFLRQKRLHPRPRSLPRGPGFFELRRPASGDRDPLLAAVVPGPDGDPAGVH
jgi:hypothetical protein